MKCESLFRSIFANTHLLRGNANDSEYGGRGGGREAVPSVSQSCLFVMLLLQQKTIKCQCRLCNFSDNSLI